MLTDEMLRETSKEANEIGDKKYTKEDVKNILTAYSTVMINTLTTDKEDKFPMIGVGKFAVKHVDAKTGVSSLTGKQWYKDAEDQLILKISDTVKVLA